MQATSTATFRTDGRPAAHVPTQASPTAVADAARTCGCGQDLDARHLRCTRCGR